MKLLIYLCTIALLTAGTVVIPAVPAAAQSPAQQAATPAPTDARLAGLIAQIRQSPNAIEAAKAYGSARVLAPDNLEMLAAYMQRMLYFDLLDAAYDPARRLTTLDPENALAWAVVGSMQAQRGQPAEAFVAAMRAASLDITDAYVLELAGRMAAWYDLASVTDTENIPAVSVETLRKFRASLSDKPAFAKAYHAYRSTHDQDYYSYGQVAAEEPYQAVGGTTYVLPSQEPVSSYDTTTYDQPYAYWSYPLFYDSYIGPYSYGVLNPYFSLGLIYSCRRDFYYPRDRRYVDHGLVRYRYSYPVDHGDRTYVGRAGHRSAGRSEHGERRVESSPWSTRTVTGLPDRGLVIHGATGNDWSRRTNDLTIVAHGTRTRTVRRSPVLRSHELRGPSPSVGSSFSSRALSGRSEATERRSESFRPRVLFNGPSRSGSVRTSEGVRGGSLELRSGGSFSSGRYGSGLVIHGGSFGSRRSSLSVRGGRR